MLDGNLDVAERNSLFDSVVLDDLQIQGDDCVAEHNLITTADRAGVFVSGNRAKVEHNRFVDMPVGILKLARVQGFQQDDNIFVQVSTEFVDPAPDTAPQAVPEQP